MPADRRRLLALVMFLGLTMILAAHPAVAEETFAPFTAPDAKIMSPPAEPTDTTPVVSIGESYLSDKQFGVSYGGKKINTIRPGESIYGVYNTKLSGTSATLYRTYKIAKYNLSQLFDSYYSPGDILLSWGFEIPDNKAANGDAATFYFRLAASGGNSVYKNLNFTVKRDGIVNSTRAYQLPLADATKVKVIANVKKVKSLLQTTSRLKYNTTYYPSSANAANFLATLKVKRPNATLIHAHGSPTDGGRILLVDDSYVNAARVLKSFTGDNVKYKPPGGLFYAAVCSGAKFATLGDAFVTAGYKAFIGYRVTVYTTRNADFYRYFFTKATQANVTVTAALNATKAWALAKTPPWDDVATARIIGNGSVVYLGGKTTTAAAEQEDKEIKDVTPPFTDWIDVDASQPGYYEMQAVRMAEDLPAVQALKREYGADLATGVEELATVYRVAYKDKVKNIFLYGVDVDKATGQIVAEGDLD